MLLALALVIFFVALIGFLFYLREKFLLQKVESANERIGNLVEEKRNLTKKRDEVIADLAEVKRVSVAQAEEIRKVVHQRKSSEVRTGQIAEQMAPFLEDFPYDPKKASFLGNPIDFVVFDEEGVHFVEVKSGKSRLSSVQRRIRDSIKAGSVSFELYRIKGE